MQTIITKTMPQTETKGRRVKASCQGGSVTAPWNYDMGADDNHRLVALELAAKLGWDCVLVSGSDGVKGYHNPLYAAKAKCDEQGLRNHKAGQVERVDQDSEEGAMLQLDSHKTNGRRSKWLNIDRRTVRAIMALFNDQNA